MDRDNGRVPRGGAAGYTVAWGRTSPGRGPRASPGGTACGECPPAPRASGGGGGDAYARLKERADNGDGQACSLMGLLFVKGEADVDGTVIRRAPDDERALRYLWRAANLGNYDHAFYLAGAYYGGLGVDADTARAVRLFELCAMTGSSSAEMSREAFVRCADPAKLEGESLRRYRTYRRETARRGGRADRLFSRFLSRFLPRRFSRFRFPRFRIR